MTEEWRLARASSKPRGSLVEPWVTSDLLHGQAVRFERSVYSNSYQGRDKHFGRPLSCAKFELGVRATETAGHAVS